MMRNRFFLIVILAIIVLVFLFIPVPSTATATIAPTITAERLTCSAGPSSGKVVWARRTLSCLGDLLPGRSSRCRDRISLSRILVCRT